jgi:soluble lytic murein transglycosylase
MHLLVVIFLIFGLGSSTPAQLTSNSMPEPSREAEAMLREALSLDRAGSLEAAITLYHQAAEPKDFILSDYARFVLANSYFNLQQYDAAAQECVAMIALYPKSVMLPRTQLLLGKCYLAEKKFKQATITLKRLISDYGAAVEVAEARYLLAKGWEQQKKWKEAYLAYEETDLYHPLTVYGKESRLAIKALRNKYKKKLPFFKASPQALFKKGMVYFEQDDFEMAANIFGRLAREYPRSKPMKEAWLMLGRAEMQRNKIDSAISDLRRLTGGPPNLAGRANYYLGIAYGRRGEPQKAIAALKKVMEKYPGSDLADDAAYWAAYYQEKMGEINPALLGYYELINHHPYSELVPAAIWRIGRAYYWSGDFKNAAAYFHMAQLYPPGEETPRSIFFEAKALEREGNQAAALQTYEKLIKRFDHTYYAYRSREKISGSVISDLGDNQLLKEDFSSVLEEIGEEDREQLAAVMEIWEETNGAIFTSEISTEAVPHLEKYKELMALGMVEYAAEEARFLVEMTSAKEKEPLQTKLGEILVQSGEYRTPIRFADRRIRAAIISGNQNNLPRKIWELAYPKGYWKQVSKLAKAYSLDPYLVLAVIREESRFNPKATSRSYARGLMQIIPRTGRGIAQDLEIKGYKTRRLYEPNLNIEMGSYFLHCLVKNFSDNAYLALAGYNGGPNRITKYVKNWYNGDLGLVDVDEFVESIPILETRLYVQKVMGSYFEYKRLYDRKS